MDKIVSRWYTIFFGQYLHVCCKYVHVKKCVFGYVYKDDSMFAIKVYGNSNYFCLDCLYNIAFAVNYIM